MKYFLLGVISLIILIGAFVIWRYFDFQKSNREYNASRESNILPVIRRLQAGMSVEADEVNKLAQRKDTRSDFYRALYEAGKLDLFPKQYSNLDQIAESDLVIWLLHPTELGSIPDEIVMTKAITLAEGNPPKDDLYFVFKFRTLPPHWASGNGWAAGIAGPYPIGELPLISPSCVFSRFDAYDSATPEEHLRRSMELLNKVWNR